MRKWAIGLGILMVLVGELFLFLYARPCHPDLGGPTYGPCISGGAVAVWATAAVIGAGVVVLVLGLLTGLSRSTSPSNDKPPTPQA